MEGCGGLGDSALNFPSEEPWSLLCCCVLLVRKHCSRGPFLESPDNFSGTESYFVRAMFTLKTQISLVLEAELV